MQQPQRETTTDSLAAIIQILQLGYKSGTLTVERSAGEGTEEGYLLFSKGRVVDASAGQYAGATAFHYLKAWGICRFSFIDGASPLQAYGDGTGSIPATRPLKHGAMTPLLPGKESANHTKKLASPPLFPVRSPAGEASLYSPASAATLPRVHRRLLLLINGQRSQGELSRLIGRNMSELQILLNDLEHAGLIRQ